MVIFYISNLLCQAEVKCKNCPKISEDIKASKINGFYIGTYESDTKIIKLKNYDEKIGLKNIWAENSWILNTDNCLCSKIEKTNGYNIVLEFNRRNKDFTFTLTPITEDRLGKASFGIGESKKEMRFENLPNKLEIIVEERNPAEGIGWKKSIVTDTIILKQKKNKL